MKTLKITLNGAEKEVEFKEVYTRKVDREFNECLFGDGLVSADNLSISPMNIQKANDYLVGAMTNLSKDEIDCLAQNDYEAILKMVNEIKTPTK